MLHESEVPFLYLREIKLEKTFMTNDFYLFHTSTCETDHGQNLSSGRRTGFNLPEDPPPTVVYHHVSLGDYSIMK